MEGPTTVKDAKRIFAELMQQSRTRKLSETELRKLSEARQQLRRAKRPAMNGRPRRSKRNSAGQYIAWLGGKSGRGGFSSVARGNRPRKRIVKPNPHSKMLRLGRALEVRYHREIGSQPGYYKHEIASRRAGVYTIPKGWVYVKGKSILITEGQPHV